MYGMKQPLLSQNEMYIAKQHIVNVHVGLIDKSVKCEDHPPSLHTDKLLTSLTLYNPH